MASNSGIPVATDLGNMVAQPATPAQATPQTFGDASGLIRFWDSFGKAAQVGAEYIQAQNVASDSTLQSNMVSQAHLNMVNKKAELQAAYNDGKISSQDMIDQYKSFSTDQTEQISNAPWRTVAGKNESSKAASTLDNMFQTDAIQWDMELRTKQQTGDSFSTAQNITNAGIADATTAGKMAAIENLKNWKNAPETAALHTSEQIASIYTNGMSAIWGSLVSDTVQKEPAIAGEIITDLNNPNSNFSKQLADNGISLVKDKLIEIVRKTGKNQIDNQIAKLEMTGQFNAAISLLAVQAQQGNNGVYQGTELRNAYQQIISAQKTYQDLTIKNSSLAAHPGNLTTSNPAMKSTVPQSIVSQSNIPTQKFISHTPPNIQGNNVPPQNYPAGPAPISTTGNNSGGSGIVGDGKTIVHTSDGNIAQPWRMPDPGATQFGNLSKDPNQKAAADDWDRREIPAQAANGSWVGAEGKTYSGATGNIEAHASIIEHDLNSNQGQGFTDHQIAVVRQLLTSNDPKLIAQGLRMSQLIVHQIPTIAANIMPSDDLNPSNSSPIPYLLKLASDSADKGIPIQTFQTMFNNYQQTDIISMNKFNEQLSIGNAKEIKQFGENVKNNMHLGGNATRYFLWAGSDASHGNYVKGTKTLIEGIIVTFTGAEEGHTSINELFAATGRNIFKDDTWTPTPAEIKLATQKAQEYHSLNPTAKDAECKAAGIVGALSQTAYSSVMGTVAPVINPPENYFGHGEANVYTATKKLSLELSDQVGQKIIIGGKTPNAKFGPAYDTEATYGIYPVLKLDGTPLLDKTTNKPIFKTIDNSYSSNGQEITNIYNKNIANIDANSSYHPFSSFHLESSLMMLLHEKEEKAMALADKNISILENQLSSYNIKRQNIIQNKTLDNQQKEIALAEIDKVMAPLQDELSSQTNMFKELLIARNRGVAETAWEGVKGEADLYKKGVIYLYKKSIKSLPSTTEQSISANINPNQ